MTIRLEDVRTHKTESASDLRDKPGRARGVVSRGYWRWRGPRTGANGDSASDASPTRRSARSLRSVTRPARPHSRRSGVVTRASRTGSALVST
jgi:hypothetical protein